MSCQRAAWGPPPGLRAHTGWALRARRRIFGAVMSYRPFARGRNACGMPARGPMQARPGRKAISGMRDRSKGKQMERASKWLVTVLLSAVCITAAPPDAFADVTATGDVDPADPATWTSSTYAYVGKTAVGSVTVDGNSDVVSGYAYIGYGSGSPGVEIGRASGRERE